MSEMTLTLTGSDQKPADPEVARLGRPSEIVLRYPDPEPLDTNVPQQQDDGSGGVALAILTTVVVVGVLVVAGMAMAEDDRRWRQRRLEEAEREAERDKARRERQAKIDDLRVKAAKLRSEAIGYEACDRRSQAATCYAQADSLERDANRMASSVLFLF